MTTKRTRPGIEVLFHDKLDILKAQRIGLVCNQASVLPDLRHTADVFFEHPEINLTTLFGPQHGIRGDVQYNMIETPHVRDTRTGLMVYSLYSETRVPTEEMVADIDTFVIDLQDVGCRIYTYTYTMANCMIAAAKFGKRVIVCDRPNPINGVTVEGNVTEKEFTSFVGQFELPTRPGMTIGEMAKMFNEHWSIGCELEIVQMEGWRREMWHEETGLPWVLPSPNIPTIDTCAVFPATVHLEGTELSEGRGTTLPFELNGAPFIDPYAWAAELRKFDFPGVAFREAYFQPTFCEFAGQTCGGVQLHVTDRSSFTPVIVGIAMVKTAYDMYPEHFQWRQNAYEYEFGKNPFDVVCGTDKIRKAIEAGESVDMVASCFGAKLAEFGGLRKNYLLY
ncbi:MAG: exo-beta-N-acetylmuramidase NamZ domain-containing protein [Pyrinomonadaceae bacterium]